MVAEHFLGRTRFYPRLTIWFFLEPRELFELPAAAIRCRAAMRQSADQKAL